jgi:putative FmdB family regulatory protein
VPSPARALLEDTMPTYAYACTACDHRLEVVQSFSDDALTECPECGGRLRKVFGSVGVVFKGSGFYRTDSRASTAKASNGTAAPKEAAKSGDSAATKPAKETTSKPSSTTSASGTGSAA